MKLTSFFSAMLVFISCSLLAQSPTITFFSPANGPIGTEVTILGSNFDPVPENNIVYFGGVKAEVISTSATELIVEVPTGASSDFLIANVGGLIAQSHSRFLVTFDSDESIGRSPDTFADEVTFTAGNDPYGFDMGDLDGDGLVDITTGNWTGENYSIFLNNSSGHGNINFAAKSDFVSNAHINDLLLADLDGDGQLDIAAVTEDDLGTTYLEVVRNTTSGPGTMSFTIDANITLDGVSYVLDVADFNGDGKIDILVMDSDNGVASVYENSSVTGSISFEDDVDFSINSDPWDVAYGDINVDGLPDIVTLDGSTNTLSILENTSSGGSLGFASKVDLPLNPSISSNSDWIEVGDLNTDGLPDIIVKHENSLSILKNETSTSIAMAAPDEIGLDLGFGSFAMDDFNGDGKLDLLVPSLINQIAVLRNMSDGSSISFASEVKFSTSTNYYPSAFSSADLDGDGEPDIAGATYDGLLSGNYKVEVLRNHSSKNEITAFSFSEQLGEAMIDASDRTVQITVAGVIDLTALDASFELSRGATASVESNPQTSGISSNDFTNPVIYTVLAEDGSTSMDWTVTVSLGCVLDETNLTEVACDSYDFDGQIIGTSGTYTRDYINRFGCDSTVTVDLTINPTAFYENVYAVGSYSFDGATLTASGQYSYGPFTSTGTGCDSTFFLNLTVEPDTYDAQGYLQFQVEETKFPIIEESGVSHIEDVDGDGEKDLFITGKSTEGVVASLFLNDGDGTFIEKANHGITGARVGNRSSLFLKANNDDDLDFLVIGLEDGSNITKLYLNDGAGNFTEKTDHGLPNFGINVLRTYLDRADVDGDEDLDLVISIYDIYSSYQPQLWLNNGDGSFILSTANDFPTVDASLADFADFDMDGDQDLLLRGLNQPYKLWLNDGTGVFTQKLDRSLATLSSRGMVMFDLDGDGDLDIYDSNTSVYSDLYTAVYFNNGNGSFTYDISSEMPRLDGYAFRAGCLSKAADFDNDGDLDLIMEGRYRFSGGPPEADYLDVWLNNGYGHFIPLLSHALTQTFPSDTYQFGRELGYGQYQYNKTLSVHDFDKDGQLDILLCGDDYFETGEFVSRIFSSKEFSNYLVVEVCESYEFDGATLAVSGNYQGDYIDEFGTSYPVNLDLTILEPDIVEEILDHCGTYEFGTQLLTESGIYTETFMNQAGCDSTVTLTFGYSQEPFADILENGVVLFAETDIEDATYQWYDCDTGEAIVDETKQQLTPPRTGNYYVEISSGTCTSATDCTFFDWVLATQEKLQNEAQIYPTQTNGNFTLDLNQNLDEVHIRIISLDGRIVKEESYESFSKQQLQFEAEQGLYVVQVSTVGQVVLNQRIIKK